MQTLTVKSCSHEETRKVAEQLGRAMRDEQTHWNEALLQRVFYRYVETPE